jgi:hypothetical protein
MSGNKQKMKILLLLLVLLVLNGCAMQNPKLQINVDYYPSGNIDTLIYADSITYDMYSLYINNNEFDINEIATFDIRNNRVQYQAFYLGKFISGEASSMSWDVLSSSIIFFKENEINKILNLEFTEKIKISKLD